jgi:hypothetical protein
MFKTDQNFRPKTEAKMDLSLLQGHTSSKMSFVVEVVLLFSRNDDDDDDGAKIKHFQIKNFTKLKLLFLTLLLFTNNVFFCT